MGTFRTYPDWNVSLGQLPSPDSDMSELAARLGSPSLLRRRGRVIYYDDFENGMAGWQSGNLRVGVFGPPAVTPYRGSGCCRILPTAGGFTEYIYKPIPLIEITKVGIELYAMTAKLLGSPTEFEIRLDHNPAGAGYYIYKIQVDLVNQDLEIWDGSIPGWVKVADVNQWGYPYWQNIKMVLDLVNHTYSLIEYNENGYDVSGYQAENGAGSSEGLLLFVTVSDTDGTELPGFVDDVIVTIDEA